MNRQLTCVETIHGRKTRIVMRRDSRVLYRIVLTRVDSEHFEVGQILITFFAIFLARDNHPSIRLILPSMTVLYTLVTQHATSSGERLMCEVR